MFDQKNVAVLLGDVNLFRSITGTKLIPYVLSRDPADVLRHSRFFKQGEVVADPSSNPDGFIDDLIKVGKKFTYKPALFFCNDGILLLVSRRREELQKYFLFLMPPPEMVEGFVDKTLFGILSEKYHLPVPKTIRSTELNGSLEALKDIRPPCIFKPDSRHNGWDESDLIKQEGGEPQKVLRADTEEEFHRLLKGVRQFTSNFVIQPYIPGGDDCIYSFHAYYDRNSRPLAYFVGRKIRTYPKDSGVSTYLELVDDPEVVRVGMDVLEKLNFVGPVKLDFKKDIRDGKLYLLELNARCTLWNHLGAVSGVNIPLTAWADLNGEECELQNKYRVGVKWLSFGNDFRAFIRNYRPDKDLTWPQYLLSFRGPKIYDVFSWSDPKPALINFYMHTKDVISSLVR